MLQLTCGTELTSACVDLATSVVAVPLIVVLCKTKGNDTLRQKWTHFLLLMAIANFIGFVTHAFVMSYTTNCIIWIGLFPLMFCIAESFATIALYKWTNGKYPTKKVKTVMRSASIAMCVVSVVIRFFTKTVIPFVIYAVAVDLPALVLFALLATKRRDKACRVLFAVIPVQLFGLYFQLTRSGTFRCIWTFDYNGIYHLCLLVSVVLIALSAFADVKAQAESALPTAQNTPLQNDLEQAQEDELPNVA